MPASRSSSGSPSRSLADDLRARDDEQLRTLIRRRPDLARPAPADLTSLAARASTRSSIQRALDSLDRGHLQVLEALLVSGDPVDVRAAAQLVGEPRTAVAAFVDRLWSSGLLWKAGRELHVVRTIGEVVGPHPAGLGPSAQELRGSTPADLADTEALDALIGSAPPPARAILDRLAWGPHVGVLAGEGPLAAAGAWLLARHLIVSTSADHVALPREVALRLRGGRLHREPALRPPAFTLREHQVASVDAAAGAQASDLLGFIDELAADWGPRPPRVLRAGGLAVRDLKRLGAVLDVEQSHAAFVAELAHGAGLLADDGSLEPVWAPTPEYDEWAQRPSAQRWAHLAAAWLASGRAAHLVGTTSPPGGTVNALGADVLWPPVRALRLDVLDELADLPAGQAPDPDSLATRIRWRRPLRTPDTLDAVVAAVAQEAEWLGVTGRAALGTAARRLLEDSGDTAAAGREMASHLPAPVEHVLLQADLTAIAPGRLEGALAQFMRLVADVESRGGATVYRFSPDSLRRALDAGWSSAQVVDALRDASRTPVPQPLEYLVGDVGRRHGRTRVGCCDTYVRSDDESVLDSMVADRGLNALQLRRIAPTVLVTSVQAVTVLEMLRENGFAPMAEAPDGAVLVPAGSQHRTPARRRTGRSTPSRVDDAFAGTLVATLRAGEDSAAYQRGLDEARPGPALPATEPAVTLALLREAAADHRGVWIGYADADGQAARILFHPGRVDGGRVHGTVEGSTMERSFSIHRITGVAG